ncbi:MAG: beta-phosphoglucomutase family hydrolase [Acidimicrobiales bacterium]
MPSLDRRDVDAVIFDVDGVVTDTARIHADAWTAVFDDLLRRRADTGCELAPFTPDDYLAYVDGRSRFDGVTSFLASRGIELPHGSPDDPPGNDTVCAVGNRKDRSFVDLILRDGVQAFPDTVSLIDRLAEAGIAVAAVSASRNTGDVLRAGHVIDRFAVRVDGVVADRLGLAGKPDPALFLEAAQRLGVRPDRAVVVEDAQAGVEAGRRGGFALVIGLARAGSGETLAEHGADVVVADLDAVDVR